MNKFTLIPSNDMNSWNYNSISIDDCKKSLNCIFNYPTKDYLRDNLRLVEKVFPLFNSEYDAYNMIINNAYLFKTDNWWIVSYSYLLQVLKHSWKCKNINVVKVKFLLNSYELFLINRSILNTIDWFSDKFQVLKWLYANQKDFRWKNWDKLSFITIVNVLDFCWKFQWVNTAALKVEISAYLFYVEKNWEFAKLILNSLWKKFSKQELIDLLNKSYRDKDSVWKSIKSWQIVSNSYRFRIVNYIIRDFLS